MIKTILWDFDGVILDSMPVREYGFRKIFEDFDNALVEKLLDYHNQNGGLSRYVKIKYFYEELLGQGITEEKIIELAEKFSTIMKRELIKTKYLITETVDFIKQNYKKYNFHIVSGSDEKELRFLCKELDVDKYFISIYGSPIHKNDLVKNIFNKYDYNKYETILIGDSVNDYEASKVNGIDFYGYNNLELKDVSKSYILNFSNIFFFDYGIGEISHAKENKTFYNIKSNNIDYLIFFDSRGLTVNNENYENSYLYKFLDKIKKNNKTYIAISRPKNVTILESLINFLKNNKKFKFQILITNLGFVDYTPKKLDVINDMKLQLNNNKYMKILISDKYTLALGSTESLYNLEYKVSYIEYINKVLNKRFQRAYFISTPIIDENINIDRARPKSFFMQISKTNELLDNLIKINSNFFKIDISELCLNKNLKNTYDAVHYTENGHCEIFNILNFKNF